MDVFSDMAVPDVDLYSDTKTRPTQAMRKAICEAEVGDEQSFEDPTVTKLTRRMAEMLGHEDAVFLPSGTMANEISVLLHCAPGDELIAHETSHLLNFEGGAPAALAGVMTRSLTGEAGTFEPDALQNAVRVRNRLLPISKMVVVEQATNLGGGALWDLDQLKQVAAVARKNDLKLHLDGARLMNAVVATGVRPIEYGSMFDTVFVDFTKGLGAPLGAVLAGSADLIQRAWRLKQRLGGSMRQAGMMAAGCLYALDHHIERLAEDHRNAERLAEGLGDLSGISVEKPRTNMVFADVGGLGMNAAEFAARMAGKGIRVSVVGQTRIRAVTHLDVDADAVEKAINAARDVAVAK
jgi:threonine aldolase